MAGPLEGIKLLDISQAAAGPIAGALLAELGADAIKVEPPWGDFMRSGGFIKNGISIFVLGISRGERSIVLDLKKEKDRQLMMELVKWADVFLENYKTGTADKMGLGYEDLRKVNPRIIYASAAGYGHKGPLRHQGTFGGIAVTFAGWGNLSGPPGGRGETPRWGGMAADPVSPTYVTLAILMALYHRELTGKGQKIEMSQVETSTALQQTRAAMYFATGKQPAVMGSASPHIVPSQAFKTRDDYLVVEAPNNRMWERLCQAISAPGLAKDHRFATNALRVENRNELVPRLEEILLRKSAAEWLGIFREYSVPCALVAKNLNDIYADPQIKANKLIYRMEHPKVGWVKMAQGPWEFSKTPTRVRSLGPTLGEHSKEIRRQFGFPEEDEKELEAARASRQSTP